MYGHTAKRNFRMLRAQKVYGKKPYRVTRAWRYSAEESGRQEETWPELSLIRARMDSDPARRAN